MKKMKLIIFFILVIVYVCVFYYRYKNTKVTQVEYYEPGSKIEYAGIEYEINAKLYNMEEMMEEFELDEIWLKNACDGYIKKFIVCERNMTKLDKDADAEINLFYKQNILSKYWQCGLEVEITDEIQKEDYKELEELEVGESTSGYVVFSIAETNLCERLWKDAENATVYYDFRGYEGSDYVRRVKILN